MDRENFLKSNPSVTFFYFWEAECEYKPLEEQLKILYDEQFEWFSQAIVSVLNKEDKKLCDLHAVRLVLPTFEKLYPKNTIPRETIDAIENNEVSKQVIDNIEHCLDECGSDWNYSENEEYGKAFAAANSIFLLADAPFSPDSVVFWATEADESIKEKIYKYVINLLRNE